MGGGYYHGDVTEARAAVGTTRNVRRAFEYHDTVQLTGKKGVHPELNVHGKIRECCDSDEHPNSTPIVIPIDVTSSRGEDAKKIYAQLPSMLGSLRVMGIVPDPMLCFGAVGDLFNDVAPIQLGQFESDRRIDRNLSNIWMEEGGGGTGEESYELMAAFLAFCTRLDCAKRGKKGFAFFHGDEAPYAELSVAALEKYLGVTKSKPLASTRIFEELQTLYHTFLIYPRSSAEQRKADIDTEIRKRLEAAGGRFLNVDIRASLIWNNRDDLDLHCLTPSGFHIFYGSRRSRCGGELDVDRNVRGEDPKPVENIRWARGDAPRGKYHFWVELFRHHEPASNVPFKVELDVNGKIETFEGRVRSNRCHEKISAFEFTYDPTARKKAESDDGFAAYGDDVVLEKWSRYIPAGNILRIEDANSSVEIMLGALALHHGMSFEDFLADMKKRKVSKGRRDDVEAALRGFAEQGVFAEVDAGAFG